ncbi:MAG: hypothetical protein V4671_00090 [Armatimonadota bacterium]
MQVKQAKEASRQWVREEGSLLPGFVGAFFHGSISGLADEAVLPATSDIDVMVVLSGPAPGQKLGKFVYQGALLEVSFLEEEQVRSAEQILQNYHLAGSFRVPGIIQDTSGRLSRLQAAVSEDYAKRLWVRRRCDHAQGNILNFLASQNEAAPLHDRVMGWLFAAGVTTHVLLVAGLKNPTVRRRYVAVQELLTQYRLLHFYEPLLEMLGCASLSRKQAEHHLAAVTLAFDAAKAVIKTPYRFAADLTDLARPVAIDGSRELIERGLHREAIFWMLATYSRCQWVLAHDAPEALQEEFSAGYRYLLADMGIASEADIPRRCDAVRQSLPQVREVAESIIAANPEIED